MRISVDDTDLAFAFTAICIAEALEHQMWIYLRLDSCASSKSSRRSLPYISINMFDFPILCTSCIHIPCIRPSDPHIYFPSSTLHTP